MNIVTILEAMQNRHSVRSYKGIPLRPDAAAALQQEIERCNREGGLHMQLVAGEPKAFDSLMAHYGKFSGVQNYIALIGKKSADLEEKLGYYGERLALFAQTLGLNTCWVALTFGKGAAKNRCTIAPGESWCAFLPWARGPPRGLPTKANPWKSSARWKALCRIGSARGWKRPSLPLRR